MGNTGLKQHYETASKTGVLQITDNKLKEFPPEVINLSGVLRNLDVSKNKLTCLPEEIAKFKYLKQLNVESNKLDMIPNMIANLQKLEVLNVSNNHLSSLPQSLSSMINLKQIYINNNKLSQFPKQLIGLQHLDVVELSNNKITKIPSGMNDFYAAELNLSQNEISSIGDDLFRAPRLKVLRLEENCLSLDAISVNLLKDSKIHTLSLEGNLFEVKQLTSLEGYNEYTERYTAMKKKMF